MSRSRRALHRALLALLLSTPNPAHAHEWWLTATPWHPTQGDTVELRAWVGTGAVGEPRIYAAARALHLSLRTAGLHDLRPSARDSAATFARVAAADGGGLAFAYESDFARIVLPAAEFEAYLQEEGLEWVARSRQRRGQSDRPGRERYARCARTWVAGDSSGRVTQPAGLSLEFVPLFDPTRPGPAALELRLHGRPLTAALVRLWRRPLDAAATDTLSPAFQGRTDLDGRIRLPDLGPGFYLASTVHMEPCREREVADWQSRWSSLTFVRPIVR